MHPIIQTKATRFMTFYLLAAQEQEMTGFYTSCRGCQLAHTTSPYRQTGS
jgi:hypothetical protein